MTLELLICTVDEHLDGLAGRLLPARPDVRYLVSCQYLGEEPPAVSDGLQRPDVSVFFLAGRGLCRNRNHALQRATGDVVKICDDDENWLPEDFDVLLDTYRRHPDYDLVHFQARGIDKVYPPRYVSSWEITLRRKRLGDVRFDERFGLGSPFLSAGEEDVFLCDARRAGLVIRYEPQTICRTQGPTTGCRYRDARVQRSKGAALCYTRGVWYARYRCLREALGWMVRKHINPVPMYRNMLWGIRYIRS